MGTGGAPGKAAQSTHQLLRRHPQATEQPTHHLFRGQSVWQGISCIYSLGQRLISFKGKQSQTIASKLCMRRVRCRVTDGKPCSGPAALRGCDDPIAEAEPSTAHYKRGR